MSEGFGFGAVDPRAIIHSGALLQPLCISFLLCCSCYAFWDMATGLSTFSCCIYGNTGFISSLSHSKREEIDSLKCPMMLNRCHHIVEQFLMTHIASQPELPYNVIMYRAGFTFKGHCLIFHSVLFSFSPILHVSPYV